MLPHVGKPELFPTGKFTGFAIPEIAGLNHYHAWVDAVFSGVETSDNFAYAGPLTEAVQLGNVATRFPGVELKWDAAALQFPGHPDAGRLLTREYRDGWAVGAAG